ncbi:hypothetical protein [Streptomyces atratus]|uniref:hypothetical protein n=1 Tax=Streptomyces atratus TaxID=1893 RepID=UPI00225B5D4C|nr:hypothetical protein [Streptomyces atratus]MCX5342036.1 hypothetical protein [Streptomyces atratus]
MPGAAPGAAPDAALLAGAREDALARPLVFAGAAFLCAALLWATAAEPIGRPTPVLQR